MQAEIQQWNGHLAVCLPEAIATEIQMTAGMNVEIEIVNGKLMIHPSGLSDFYLWVKTLETDAGICGCELPIYRLL